MISGCCFRCYSYVLKLWYLAGLASMVLKFVGDIVLDLLTSMVLDVSDPPLIRLVKDGSLPL